MEKSTVSAINKHVNDDLAFLVLSKLPIKPLTRFRCVRKSWYQLLENSYFMNMFRKNFLFKNHSFYNDTSLLLYYDMSWFADNLNKSGMYSLSGERFENMIYIDWSNLFNRDEWSFNVLGSTSINGYLCIEGKHTGRVILWNPTTEEYKVIPPSPFSNQSIVPQVCLYGFGFDSIKDDYKIIQHLVFSHGTYNNEDATWKDGSSLWEIYCLKSNSWNTLDVNMPTYYLDEVGAHAYMDGVCHWLGKSKTGEWDCDMHNEVELVSFTLSTEMFVTTSLPSNLSDNDYKYLAILNGTITLILSNAETTSFEISILREVGTKDSWVKLFIIKSLACIECPIGVSKNGDIFFIKKNEELAWFNLGTQNIGELCLKGAYYCKIINY
ncbi:F-box/kelch-repeat protein At3g23880-like [Vicia villosa]|uniref:F-box/kelch-repeat protein At3g23880-like n=1 Tax=Vicia villosa TaxID=3911 RepID=UPI00273BAAF6|nr:F-box/kelch-repeat protein At3g23880-like [Vicia villosa]